MARKKGMTKTGVAALGAGAVALGAGAYYFLGPKGKQHQRTAKKWTVDAKKKIVQEIKEAKEMSEPVYHKIVDNVVLPYMEGDTARKEVMAFAKALKQDWGHILRASKAGLGTSARRGAKKVAKVKSKVRSVARKVARKRGSSTKER